MPRQFDYYFDEKPEYNKQAEKEELARLALQVHSRQAMNEVFGNLLATFGWTEHIRPPHLGPTE
jgi:hypothetical protein